MAERRMFTMIIVDSDAFLGMPLSAQALYFHLCMRADDDGFLNNARRIQRTIDAKEDDFNLLITKEFIITFDSGIVVIKHWKMHNSIQKDRYKPTTHTLEAKQITLEENKLYTKLHHNDSTYETACTQDVSILEPQDSSGQDSSGQDSSDESNTPPTPPQGGEVPKKKRRNSSYITEDEGTAILEKLLPPGTFRDAMASFVSYRIDINKQITEKGLELLVSRLLRELPSDTERIACLEQSITNGWQGVFPENINRRANGTGRHPGSKESYGLDLDAYDSI